MSRTWRWELSFAAVFELLITLGFCYWMVGPIGHGNLIAYLIFVPVMTSLLVLVTWWSSLD